MIPGAPWGRDVGRGELRGRPVGVLPIVLAGMQLQGGAKQCRFPAAIYANYVLKPK